MEYAVSQVLTLNNISGWSKKELTDFALSSVEEVAENGQDTLALLSLAAKLEHFAGEVKKAAKGRGVSDLSLYGKAGVAKAGVKLVLRETGVKYDYSLDPVWNQYNGEVEAATDNRKAWEKMLSNLPPAGLGVTHPDTGETYHAYPPSKTASESIQATIL